MFDGKRRGTMRIGLAGLAGAIVLLAAHGAQAGDVDIVKAEAKATGDGAYTFSVTLKHGDTGWDHYANAWDVVAPDGTVLGTRKLLHPHVNEQPFTRSLGGVKVPSGMKTVTIRAYDSVHGRSNKTKDVQLAE